MVRGDVVMHAVYFFLVIFTCEHVFAVNKHLRQVSDYRSHRMGRGDVDRARVGLVVST